MSDLSILDFVCCLRAGSGENIGSRLGDKGDFHMTTWGVRRSSVQWPDEWFSVRTVRAGCQSGGHVRRLSLQRRRRRGPAGGAGNGGESRRPGVELWWKRSEHAGRLDFEKCYR